MKIDNFFQEFFLWSEKGQIFVNLCGLNFRYSEVVTLLAGKKFFATLDCSQAYHALQKADPLSVQLLSLHFLSRTFAYLRLAQGRSLSVSAFSSLMRKYLYPCIVADQCFQYVDDLGTAAKTFEEFITNIEAIFVCIEKAGLKLTPGK